MPVSINAQNLKYELAYEINISRVKEPILYMDVDDLGFLYIITDKGLYFYDCHTPVVCSIIDTIPLNTSGKSRPLVNNSGEIFFSEFQNDKTQIFDENGAVKLVLIGENPSSPIKQILLDSRGFFILAGNQKIIYYDPNGHMDHIINFDKAFKIICLDNKNNIYVLKKSVFTPEQREKIAWLDKRLQNLNDDISQIDADLNKIMIEKGNISLDLEKQKQDEMIILDRIKFSPFNRFEYRQSRSFGRFSPRNKNQDNLDNQNYRENRDSGRLKQENQKQLTSEYLYRRNLYDLRKQISQTEIEERKIQIEYKEKQQKKFKLQTELKEDIQMKKNILQEASRMANETDYEMQIYDTWGDMIFTFIIPRSKEALPLYNSYLIKIDAKNNFFGAIAHQRPNNTVLDANFDLNEIQKGEADAINIYSAGGNFVGKVETTSPFNGINYHTIDNKGNLYVLDSNFSRVRKFKPGENQ